MAKLFMHTPKKVSQNISKGSEPAE